MPNATANVKQWGTPERPHIYATSFMPLTRGQQRSYLWQAGKPAHAIYLSNLITACAAAKRATGTRKGEQLT